jgi:hypothetical protein
MMYEIRVRGELGAAWEGGFDALQVTPGAAGETVLRGEVTDQAALFGLLRRVRDCGLALVSVNAVAPDDPAAAEQ